MYVLWIVLVSLQLFRAELVNSWGVPDAVIDVAVSCQGSMHALMHAVGQGFMYWASCSWHAFNFHSSR